MAIFLITKADNSTDRIVADVHFVQNLCNQHNWTYQEVIEQVVSTNVQPKILSKKEFFDTFTYPELVAIYIAAKTNPIIEVYLDKIKVSESIDLSHQEAIDGVNAIEKLGLIAVGRAKEILR